MSVREDLKAYVDGQLPPLRMQEVREAIERDPELAREVAEIQSLSVSIRQGSPSYEARGMEETLRQLSQRRSPRFAWLGWPLALAGAAGAIAIIFNPSRTQSAEAGFAVQERTSSKAAASASAMSAPAESNVAGAAEDSSITRSRAQDSKAIEKAKNPGSKFAQPQGRAAGTEKLGGNPAASQNGMGAAKRPKSVESQPETAASATAAAPPAPAAAVAMKPALTKEPEPLVIEVASVQEAEANLREAAAALGATVGPEVKSVTSASERRVSVEIAEEMADVAVRTFKAIAEPKPALRARAADSVKIDGSNRDSSMKEAVGKPGPGTPASPSKGAARGGAGGFGGAALDAPPRPAVPARAEPNHQRKEAAKDKPVRRKIVIVIRQKAPLPVKPPEVPAPGNLDL